MSDVFGAHQADQLSKTADRLLSFFLVLEVVTPDQDDVEVSHDSMQVRVKIFRLQKCPV